MTRLAIFDCDGTLVDSGDTIARAMDACFANAGLPAPPRTATRRIIGLSLTEAMAALHPAGDAARHAAMAEDYKGCFHALRLRGQVSEPMYDGVADALTAFVAGGWRLGIATGKSDRGLRLVLDAHGLADRFATLQTADRHPSKPHPAMIRAALAEAGADPADAVMIGDTSFDMAMARAAGVRAIGVAWGYHQPDELRAAGAEAVAAHPTELLALCARVPA